MALRSDSGTYRCRDCSNKTAKVKQASYVAEGLTGRGKKRSRWLTRTTEERFFEKVVVTGFCWLWEGAISAGYGNFGISGTSVIAHRWAYEHLVGPIPEGLVLDHLCRVRNCVNPDHLEPVTNEENIRRGYSISRMYRERSSCHNGHDYVEGSYYVSSKGFRTCAICARKREQEYYWKNKSK